LSPVTPIVDSVRVSTIGLGLLASAFAPLLVVLALVIQPLPGLGPNIALAVVFAAPVALLALVLTAARGLPSERVDVRTATPRDIDLIAFLASYLVPIAVGLFAFDVARLVAMIVLLVLLAVVYVGAELFYLNPILACLGYRLYQVVDDASGVSVVVLTRRRGLAAGGRVDGQLIAPNLYIELGSVR
jgi:hypothetical protein